MSGIEKVSVNGAQLAVQVDGKAGNPWIILSNSLAASFDSWRFQIPLLSKTYQVLRYDTRGHGRSSSPPGPYSFEIFVADVVGLMDHYKIAKADFLGLSMGGMTGLGLGIHHADRINRLICCDARSDAVPPFIESWNQRVASIKEAGGMKGILEFTMSRWFTPDFTQKNPAIIKEVSDMILGTNKDGYIACTEALKKLDYKRSLGSIRVPTLYVVGAQDMAAAPAVMKEMSSLTPGSAYAEVNPGAHICQMENPDGFNKVIGDWLKIKV